MLEGGVGAQFFGLVALPAIDLAGLEIAAVGVAILMGVFGQSFVAGAQGEVLYQGSPDREENVVIDIDTQRTEDVRRIWPFFRDRRIDFYDGITKRYLD